jgi:hypothetical protein
MAHFIMATASIAGRRPLIVQVWRRSWCDSHILLGCAQPWRYVLTPRIMEAPVPRPKQANDGLTTFQRYRRQQLHRCITELRIWVPDPQRPEFAAEARRQGLLLSGRPEETEALAFIAAVAWPNA